MAPDNSLPRTAATDDSLINEQHFAGFVPAKQQLTG
jgi:hypothetical protein